MIFFLLVNSEYVHSWSDTNKIGNCNICHYQPWYGACSDKLQWWDCVMCRCLTVVAELQLHWHSRKHTEIHREEERVSSSAVTPSALAPILKHTQTFQSSEPPLSVSLTHTAASERLYPSVCSPPKWMQSRSKEIQIRTALMQHYILPLLLILRVKDGLGTPLTSSPGPPRPPVRCRTPAKADPVWTGRL